MDPENYQLKAYSDIPVISKTEFQILVKSKRIVLWKDLVLDLTEFDHPGYNHIVDEFQGRDIAEAYLLRMHSLNADLIIAHKTIGRLESSKLASESKPFYNSLANNQKIKKHESILTKFDFD